ncbi:MAG: hypothetical protein ACLUI3_15595 [Christensenellales bacterium]
MTVLYAHGAKAVGTEGENDYPPSPSMRTARLRAWNRFLRADPRPRFL